MSAPQQQDRRRGDRRQGDRRSADRRSGESWFGAESAFSAGWGDEARAVWAQPFIGAEDSALTRIHRTYAAARAALGVALVLVQGLGSLMGVRTAPWLVLVCLAYAVQAVTLWLLPRFQPLRVPLQQPGQRRNQWLATIGMDLLAFGSLHLLEGGVQLNYGALLVLPVLMAGVTTPRLAALGTAAGVTLLLLGRSFWQMGWAGAELTGGLLQSGLAGLGLFFISLLAAELASRLAREEQAARGSLELARQQAQLNRLVIEEMVDGVLVVDARGRVRAANPAARALLAEVGLCPPAPFSLRAQPGWTALAAAVEQALVDHDWPEAGRDVRLQFEQGTQRTLRMRVRFMQARALVPDLSSAATAHAEAFGVLLLEDVRTAQARLQQEKLAAMGRVSAGIAHEIRNPLSAIVQATGLLLEDGLPPAQQRLARMVADNAERLKRIVDDVMELAPGTPAAARSIDIAAEVGAATAEWAATVGLPLGRDSRLQVQLSAPVSGEPAPGPLGVLFDTEHLRRVLVNLLDNAHRHASARPGAIVLRVQLRDEGHVALSVASDGERIGADVEPFLFEPFFSTRSRGTGLGLYICRELCERYGASIEYRARPPGDRWRNEFLVTLRRSPLGPANAALPLNA